MSSEIASRYVIWINRWEERLGDMMSAGDRDAEMMRARIETIFFQVQEQYPLLDQAAAWQRAMTIYKLNEEAGL